MEAELNMIYLGWMWASVFFYYSTIGFLWFCGNINASVFPRSQRQIVILKFLSRDMLCKSESMEV
jgi:hypothetical protein